jgi:hypothetical protein
LLAVKGLGSLMGHLSARYLQFEKMILNFKETGPDIPEVARNTFSKLQTIASCSWQSNRKHNLSIFGATSSREKEH